VGILRSVQAIRIFVSDLDRARQFYSDILELDEHSVETTYVVYGLAGVDVVIEAAPLGDPEAEGLVGRLLAVSFQVDDIVETHRRLLERGVSFLQPPEAQPWGGTLAFFYDPDGNILTLVG
jgi:catechol 2,3-dioxygenase-like lactoylglutathione lyase family enzyme